MKTVAASAILVGAGCLFGLQAQASDLPMGAATLLPKAAVSGQGTMKVWGFEVYQATLWVAPGFTEAAYAQTGFALELVYLRDFKGSDIARRSIAEMRRQGPMRAEDETRWENQMRTLFPDVKTGDRITGVHLPGRGAVFWGNDRRLGAVEEPEFAQLFFGIWLAPQTSEPQLRRTLLTQAKTQPAAAAAP